MDNIVGTVIRDYWETPLPEMVERDVGYTLADDHIIDIVGPRRSGKTYLMFLMIREVLRKRPVESTIYINLENRRLASAKGDVFNLLMDFVQAEGLLGEHPRVHLFLDEVQRIDGWERYVRSIYDEHKGRIKTVVSGSCAGLLGREYSKLLTGRHLTRTVLPLSFREFLRFRGMEPGKGLSSAREAKVVSLLQQYLRMGGFPEVVRSSNGRELISQLFADIVNRDVVGRSDVRNKHVMEDLADYLASNVSNLFSFNKMARYLKTRGTNVSVPALITYFGHLKDAFLFFDNPVFSHKVRDRNQYPRKIYSIDNGIAHLMAPGTDGGIGSLCENAVAVHFLREGVGAYYWKDPRGAEVDFIVRDGPRTRPVQVCSDLGSDRTKEREVRSLLKCMESLKVREGTVVSLKEEGSEVINGRKIVFRPLWKLLLGM